MNQLHKQRAKETIKAYEVLRWERKKLVKQAKKQKDIELMQYWENSIVDIDLTIVRLKEIIKG